jgi:ribosomal protein L7Ae-like RNA K-turn-binding protein
LTKVKAEAKLKSVKVIITPSMLELGKACGIEVGAAVAGIKD